MKRLVFAVRIAIVAALPRAIVGGYVAWKIYHQEHTPLGVGEELDQLELAARQVDRAVADEGLEAVGADLQLAGQHGGADGGGNGGDGGLSDSAAPSPPGVGTPPVVAGTVTLRASQAGSVNYTPLFALPIRNG